MTSFISKSGKSYESTDSILPNIWLSDPINIPPNIKNSSR